MEEAASFSSSEEAEEDERAGVVVLLVLLDVNDDRSLVIRGRLLVSFSATPTTRIAGGDGVDAMVDSRVSGWMYAMLCYAYAICYSMFTQSILQSTNVQSTHSHSSPLS